MSAKPDESLFDFWTKVKVTNAFPGDWESIFKGAGTEFFELREYEAGDDWKKIDWAKLAETGKLYVREHVALRDLRVTILLDVSGSMYFHEKPSIANTVLAVVGASTLRRGFPLGLVAFRDDVIHYIPPRAGRRNLAEIAEWHTEAEEPMHGIRPDFARIAEFVLSHVPKRSFLFLVSDFLDPERNIAPLEILRRNFDIVSVIIRDPFERDLPLDGETEVLDIHSSRHAALVFGPKERAIFRRIMAEDLERLSQELNEKGIDETIISSSEVGDCVRALRDLFWMRKVRKI